MLTGNAAAADPVCSLSPHHDVVVQAVAAANDAGQRAALESKPLVFRNPRNSKALSTQK
jgi:pyrroloquinoline quinone biosynthesis protein E